MPQAGYIPKAVASTSQLTGEHWILVPDSNADVLIVNETGGYIFSLCDGNHTCEQIAQAISDKTTQPLQTVLNDVMTFVETLRKAGLIET